MINYWKLALQLFITFFIIVLFAERFGRWQDPPAYALPHFATLMNGFPKDALFALIMSVGLTPLTIVGIALCGKFGKKNETGID